MIQPVNAEIENQGKPNARSAIHDRNRQVDGKDDGPLDTFVYPVGKGPHKKAGWKKDKLYPLRSQRPKRRIKFIVFVPGHYSGEETTGSRRNAADNRQNNRKRNEGKGNYGKDT